MRLEDPEFRIDVAPDRDRVLVRPVGEVDMCSSDLVRDQIDQLRDAGFRRVVLDLTATTFLDSTGVRLVLDMLADSSADSWNFGVMAGPPPVQRTFELAGVLERIPFVDRPTG